MSNRHNRARIIGFIRSLLEDSALAWPEIKSLGSSARVVPAIPRAERRINESNCNAIRLSPSYPALTETVSLAL